MIEWIDYVFVSDYWNLFSKILHFLNF